MSRIATAILNLAAALGLAACLPQAGIGEDPRSAAAAEAGAQASLDRQTAEVHRQLAAGLEAAGESEAAVAELESALAAEARARAAERSVTDEKIRTQDLSNRSYEELARLCKRNDPPEQAVRACSLVIAAFNFSVQRLPELLSDRAEAYLALEDLERAARDYSQAIEIDSAYGRALLGRARLRLRQGDTTEAAKDYRRAIGAGLAATEIRAERAEVLMADGQYRAAVGEYDWILSDAEAEPDHELAYRGRAMAHCRDGQAEAAAVDWQVWLAGNPEDGGAALAVPLVEAGFLAPEAAESELQMTADSLATLRAWTEAGCPVRDPTSPAESATPGVKPAAQDPPASASETAGFAAEAPTTEAPPAVVAEDEMPAPPSQATPETPAAPGPAAPQTIAPQTGASAEDPG